MEQFFYAQLDESGVCVAVSQLNGPLIADNMMRLTEEEYARGLLGQRYADGVWHEAQPPPDTPDELKTRKLDEVNAACQAAIVEGVTLTIRGVEQQFSNKAEDQQNISDLRLNLIMTSVGLAPETDLTAGIPYHANDRECCFYSAEEFAAITKALDWNKLYHTTYCNFLKQHIRRTDDMDELRAIIYGMDLPDDLAENMALLIGGVPCA